MKKLIVEEVNSFRAEVRAQARAAGQIRRQDRFVFFFFLLPTLLICLSTAFLFPPEMRLLTHLCGSTALCTEPHLDTQPQAAALPVLLWTTPVRNSNENWPALIWLERNKGTRHVQNHSIEKDCVSQAFVCDLGSDIYSRYC